MIRHLGIVTLQPIGGLVTNNPATTTQAQIDEAKRVEAERQAQAARLAAQKKGK